MAKRFKTWELLKMASEYDYDKKISERPHFKNLTTGEIKTFICTAKNVTGLGVYALDSIQALNNDWELVQQPVSFMEAVKAYSKGKKIRCRNTVYTPYGGIDTMFDSVNTSDGTKLNAREILSGTWYIEEADAE